MLEHSESRWLGTDKLAGTEVDVLLGPAVPPREVAPAGTASPRVDAPSPTPTALAKQSAAPTGSPTPAPSALAQMGGGVRYWIDASSRMHRFEALLGDDVPVEVDLNRTDNPEFVAVDAFGGLPVEARAVTAEEAAVLARVAQRNLTRGGGTLDLTVPTMPAANLRGAGWIDWKEGTAYLSVRDLDNPADVALMRADREGVAVLPIRPRANARPPLPAPTGDRWKYQRWVDRADTSGGLDLDLLVAEALTLASGDRDDPAALRQRASWLRADKIGDRAVSVYEIAKPQETGRGPSRTGPDALLDRQGRWACAASNCAPAPGRSPSSTSPRARCPTCRRCRTRTAGKTTPQGAQPVDAAHRSMLSWAASNHGSLPAVYRSRGRPARPRLRAR